MDDDADVFRASLSYAGPLTGWRWLGGKMNRWLGILSPAC